MSVQLPGLFDSFDHLDLIDINNLSAWLKPSPQAIRLENYLANRILYPQILPLTAEDMKIDLAILREALRLNRPQPTDASNGMLGDNPFLNTALRKIIIPSHLLRFVPDLGQLAWAFVDGLLTNRKKKDYFEDLWTVVLADQTDEIIGSVITPEFKDKADYVDMNILGQNLRIKAGTLTVIPCNKDRCEIAYKFLNGQLLGKKESALQIYGGRLGFIVDGRGI